MKHKIRLILPFLLFSCMLCAQTDRPQNEQKPKAIKVLQSGQSIVKQDSPSDNGTDSTIKEQDLQQTSAESIYKKLSLEEKLAQTIVIATDVDNADKYKEAIQAGLVGGVLIQWGNYSLNQTKKLIDKLQGWAQKSPHKIPLLISIDYEGGTVYTPVTLGFPYLPTNMMLAAAQNEEDTATLFYIVASELKNVGVHINFAPVVDVNINPVTFISSNK